MRTFVFSMVLCGIIISLWYIFPVGAQFRPGERDYLIERCLRAGGRPTNNGYGCIYPQPDRDRYPPRNDCRRDEHVCGAYCCPNR